jgi:hypothetical protein
MSEEFTCPGMPSTRGERWKINAAVDFVASRLPSLRFAPDAQSRAKVMLREAFGPNADSQDELKGWWPQPTEGCWDDPEAWLDAGDVRAWVRKMLARDARRVSAAGRPGGTGYARQDMPLVKQMRKHIEKTKDRNVTRAFWKVAGEDGEKAAGENTTRESKKRRVVKLYNDTYPGE